MILRKIFSFDLTVKSYELRLEDKEKEISRLIDENKELRDRLFLKNSLPVLGQELTTQKGNSIEGWLPPRRRVLNYINEQVPQTPSLTESELAFLKESAQ